MWHIECYGIWVHNTPVLNGTTCKGKLIVFFPFLDDTSRQLTAMTEWLGKGKQSLCYLYEGYSACSVILHVFEYLFGYSFTGQWKCWCGIQQASYQNAAQNFCLYWGGDCAVFRALWTPSLMQSINTTSGTFHNFRSLLLLQFRISLSRRECVFLFARLYRTSRLKQETRCISGHSLRHKA